MARNPKPAAVVRAEAIEANYRAALKALAKLTSDRKRAMVACVKAGVSQTETGRIFKVSGQAVANVLRQAREGG